MDGLLSRVAGIIADGPDCGLTVLPVGIQEVRDLVWKRIDEESMELLIPLRDREKSIFGNAAIEMKMTRGKMRNASTSDSGPGLFGEHVANF